MPLSSQPFCGFVVFDVCRAFWPDRCHSPCLNAMPRLSEYRGDQLPNGIKLQILSFIRIEWPGGFSGPNQFRDWISREEQHPVHCVLIENDILISHAAVLWKSLEHGGESSKVFGLSGVFTYPSLRRQGYGHQVVKAGTRLIRRSDGDLAMLWCDPALEQFYGAHGWIPMMQAVTLMGAREDPTENEELLMMLFLSKKGKEKRPSFETEPIYFGSDTW